MCSLHLEERQNRVCCFVTCMSCRDCKLTATVRAGLLVLQGCHASTSCPVMVISADASESNIQRGHMRAYTRGLFASVFDALIVHLADTMILRSGLCRSTTRPVKAPARRDSALDRAGAYVCSKASAPAPHNLRVTKRFRHSATKSRPVGI